MGKLTQPAVKTALSEPGKHHDGDGLFLVVRKVGQGSWIFRYTAAGRNRELGLGSATTCTLAQARELAADARHEVRKGGDPVAAKQTARKDAQLEATKNVTFREYAEQFIRLRASAWKNDKHAAQWSSSLRDYVYPVIGDLPVRDVDTALVLKILKPIWLTKTETARRLRGRIEMILDAAKVEGLRDGENPARWRGHLAASGLPNPAAVTPPQNFAAMPYAEVGAFISKLQARGSVAALALEFTILTAVRTDCTVDARAEEFDLGTKTWTIPAERMKGTKVKARELRVPLSARAIEIVRERLKQLDAEGRLFPIGQHGMIVLLQRRMGETATVHGFRSTFKDWAAETTNFPNIVSEMALAHTVSDKVEAAYRRGDLFEKRRVLMDAWARFCAQKKTGGTVTELRVA